MLGTVGFILVVEKNQLQNRKPSWECQDDKKYAINSPSYLKFRIFLKSPVWFNFLSMGGFGT
jgi:hypothetical protein